MRKIIGGVFQSLDGVMQSPGGPLEDPTGGFELGGWSTSFWDEKMGAAMGGLFGGPFDLLLGRKTYEIFAAHWPFVPENDPIGPTFTRVAKYVVTRGDEKLDWSNSHRLKTIDAVRTVKTSDGPDLLIQGSTTLYPELLAANLIDRLFVMTFPVVLGKGKRLFGSGTPPLALKLVKHELSSTGVMMATYEPAGKIPLGSFMLADPTPAEMKRRARMAREG
ncbi:MAG TPA: dihydrofolate reductase family protein [Rhizomicrobium sp.]|nr:dihydrofolate reductase family protein [Rhizomicrobium sp.]